MANTITYAKQYINNQAEVLRMFDTYLLTADLIKELVEHKGKTVAYDRMSFASYAMGNYDRSSGLSNKPVVFERVERTLSQDRGDSLDLDIMDKVEAQIADGIIGVYNFYEVKVVVPTIDAYAFGKMAEVGNGAKVAPHASLTSANIVEALFNDFAALRQKRVRTQECILYISASANALLEIASFGKGIIEVGNWGGNLDAQVKLVKGAKLVEVPDDLLGDNVQWIIAHPLAVDLIPVLAAAEFKDYIPGFVGKAQVDVRHYFDCWLQPNGEDGLIISVSAPRTPVINKGTNKATISGIETGGKAYYTTDGNAPTSSSTEYTGGEVSVSANATLKVIQYVGSTASAVASWTNS